MCVLEITCCNLNCTQIETFHFYHQTELNIKLTELGAKFAEINADVTLMQTVDKGKLCFYH